MKSYDERELFPANPYQFSTNHPTQNDSNHFNMYRGTNEDDILYNAFSKQYDQHINKFGENPSKYGGG